MSVFFSGFTGEQIVAMDKQIMWTMKRFSDSFPHVPRKTSFILYIYNASKKVPF